MSVTNVRSAWESGNLVFRDAAGSVIATFDGTNGRLLVPDTVLSVRSRFTIAQVNAGVELLPAVPGYKYRMIEAQAISIGGATTAVTTVDILGTQTSPVKLVAFAQASMTENTVLKSGGTGAAVLTGGDSYVANDEDTAITVDITGSNITVATHIDVILSYVLEAA
jgi:hypothetical protein